MYIRVGIYPPTHPAEIMNWTDFIAPVLTFLGGVVAAWVTLATQSSRERKAALRSLETTLQTTQKQFTAQVDDLNARARALSAEVEELRQENAVIFREVMAFRRACTGCLRDSNEFANTEN